MSKEKLLKGLLLALLPLALIALLFVPWILLRGYSTSIGDEWKEFFSIFKLLNIKGSYFWLGSFYFEIATLVASAGLCVINTFILNKQLFYSEIITLGVGVILFFVLQFVAYGVNPITLQL